MRLHRFAIAMLAAAGISGVAMAQSKEVKIAHIIDKTGPLELFATASNIGLMLGLEYATGGTMEVAGKKINVVIKDGQFKPDIAKSLLQSAYTDDKVDIAVGPTFSASALAMIPVARENKRLLIIDSAAAENLTGARGSRYVFRTGRNSDQDGYSNAAVLARPGYFVATLAPDYAFGREGVQSFRDAMKKAGGNLVHEEYAPLGTTDFTAQAQRIFNALKDKPGRKIVWYIWAGPGNPLKLLDQDPGRYGIEVVSGGGTVLALMPGAKPLIGGAEAATGYYFQCPKNAANDWLVKEHQKRYNSPPDFFTAQGMNSGIAIVEALKKTKGNTDTETMIAAMKGMAFDGPKGRVFFNKDNHQLMQPAYKFRYKEDPSIKGGVGLECLGEVKIEDMAIPAMVLK